jgi:hypothetical protein
MIEYSVSHPMESCVKIEFPMLMVSKRGTIILATKKTGIFRGSDMIAGVSIAIGGLEDLDPRERICGYYKENWCIDDFRPLTGSVTIKNKD